MTLDLTTAKVGDLLLLKNKSVVKVDEVDESDHRDPVCARGYWYTSEGFCHEGGWSHDATMLIRAPAEPAIVLATSTLIIGGCWEGIEHPAVIECNNKIYTPSDSWPEPITDRPPTEEDADKDGYVQVLGSDGLWRLDHWTLTMRCESWQHTANWKPPAPKLRTLKEAAKDVLEHWRCDPEGELEALMSALAIALEATK